MAMQPSGLRNVSAQRGTHAASRPKLSVHTIELCKLATTAEVEPSERAVLNWTRFMASETDEEREPNRKIQRALDVVNRGCVDREPEWHVELREMSHLAAMAHLRAEARAEGRARGREEGLRDSLTDLLIAAFGEVPAESAARIAAADVELLRRWIRRTRDAESVADVLDG